MDWPNSSHRFSLYYIGKPPIKFPFGRFLGLFYFRAAISPCVSIVGITTGGSRKQVSMSWDSIEFVLFFVEKEQCGGVMEQRSGDDDEDSHEEEDSPDTW